MACVVKGCTSQNSTKLKNTLGVSFHRFPRDDDIKRFWVKAINRINWNPTPNSRICSKHFDDNCYVGGRKRRLLKRNALPTIFENYPLYRQKECKKLASNVITNLRRNLTLTIRHIRPPIAPVIFPVCDSPRDVHKSIASLCKLTFNDTPKERNLKKLLAKQYILSTRRLKKLKVMQEKCQRQTCRITLLENVIEILHKVN